MCDGGRVKLPLDRGVTFHIEEDLRKPVQSLMRGVALLGKAGEEDKISPLGTPQSIASIEAGATAFAKWWSVAIGASGFVAVTATVARFWGELRSQPLLGIAVLAGVSLIVASVIVAVALIVRADLLARGTSSAAQYRARAEITRAYLDNVFRAGGPPRRVVSGGTDGGSAAGNLEDCPFIIAAKNAGNGGKPSPTP